MSEDRVATPPSPPRFGRYPEYRDSGVEWLGEIPAHWNAKRTKFAATLRSGHTPSRQKAEYWQDCTIPWFGLADVWQVRDGRVEYVRETAEKISEIGLANSSARLLPEGTVILSRTASVGFSAILGVDMATTQDFVNWICGPSIRPEYLLYVFRAMESEFRRLTMGSTHQTIYMHDVDGFSTPVPPISEQDQIVAFIRKETARIDALVTKQERLIDLLQEKRTVLITRAVTRGLDPDVPMRDSGLDWLGQIPAHWEVVQLRRVAFDRCDGPFGSGLKSSHYAEEGVRVVRLQNIGYGEFEGADAAFIPHEHRSKLGDHSVIPGDLLIAGLGDTNHPTGRACVAPSDIGPAMVKADCFGNYKERCTAPFTRCQGRRLA
ncbi:restriction endonuclease subunit S [Candidatus Palauibacter sp.]|uniref:restriction endonuclease subunit S n=1 Tax=Candidatus Palauibacter sp. TaxID=3101350 RepID=UPI003B58DA2A